MNPHKSYRQRKKTPLRKSGINYIRTKSDINLTKLICPLLSSTTGPATAMATKEIAITTLITLEFIFTDYDEIQQQ